MSFIGGILGVLVSLIILKKIKKIPNIQFWLLIDIILVIVPLAIIFGRFGNFLNQEIY
jgi:phosphatidylglycerol---prolipoprotein diacylglyceryl transferase